MKKYRRLSYEERVEIAALRRRGTSIRSIARSLGRSPNTVSRELREKRVKGSYVPKKAQHRTYWRRYRSKRECMKVALDPWLTQTVALRLKDGWSPERIAGWCTRHAHPVSARSVYRFAHNRCLERYLFRRRHRKKSGRKPRRAKVHLDGRRFVDERPETCGSGHFEADFIVSSHNTESLLVAVDRFTRHTRIKKLPNRKHQTVSSGVRALLADVRVKTLTLDNDIAFGHWEHLERALKTRIYFTHPYCSWEKGLVENTNRWIRLFVPRGSDIRAVTDETFRSAEAYLNEIPRQCLGYKTATEVMRLAA